MGRLARGDPMAGWRAWERQTVLGKIDREGWRDNLDMRRIQRYEIVSAVLMLRIIPSGFLMLRFVAFA